MGRWKDGTNRRREEEKWKGEKRVESLKLESGEEKRNGEDKTQEESGQERREVGSQARQRGRTAGQTDCEATKRAINADKAESG